MESGQANITSYTGDKERRDFQTSEKIQVCSSLDFDRTVNSYSIQATRANALIHGKKERIESKYDDSPSYDSEATELVKHHRRHPRSIGHLLVESFTHNDPFLTSKENVDHHRRCQSQKPYLTYDEISILSSLPEVPEALNSFDSRDSGLSVDSSNHVYHRVHRSLKISMSGRVITKWIFTCFVGLFVGLAAVVIVDCVGRIVRIREMYMNQYFSGLHGISNEESETSLQLLQPKTVPGIFCWFAIISLIPAFLSAVMCVYMAPGAAGSGIPEVKAYLNGVRVKSFSQASLLFVKIVGTILSVSSGLAIGPEGPLVHIGAIIGSSVTKTGWLQSRANRFSQSCPRVSPLLGCGSIYTKYSNVYRQLRDESKGIQTSVPDPSEDSWFSRITYGASRLFTNILYQASYFRNDPERRDFITIGSAAGFAAAFGAPVGGVLYGLEETSTFFATSLLWKTLNATAIATFCIAVYHGGLDKFSVLTLNVSESRENLTLYNFAHLPLYALVGLFGGILGALFNSTIVSVSLVRKKFYANTSRTTTFKQMIRLLEVSCLSVFTSVIIFFFPLFMPSACVPVTNFEEQSAWRLKCKAGEFNKIGKVLLGTRDDAILDILTNTETYTPSILLAIGAIFYFLQIITFGVSLPSGIFMPTILTGASLGGCFGLFLRDHNPELSPSLFALLGAAALLSGMQRTTVSLCVILMEGTGQTKVLIPVIITIVVACYIGNLFNHGIYEVLMELKEFAYLEHHDGNTVFDMFKVSDIMSTPVVVMNSIESAGTIETILLQTTHNGFPVVDKDTKDFVGLVRRDQLVALLESGVFVGEHKDNRSGTQGRSKSDFYGKNSVSISMMERNPSIINRALNIRDDRYGSVIHVDASALKKDCFCEKLCPPFCSKNNDPFLAPAALETIRKEHEWLADVIESHEEEPTGIETLPASKEFGYSDHERAVVDIDVNNNVVVHLPDSARTQIVSVEAVMNRGAHVILEGCPLSKAFELFTKMGLRHLTVIGGVEKGKVVGIITRENLLDENLEEATGFKLH